MIIFTGKNESIHYTVKYAIVKVKKQNLVPQKCGNYRILEFNFLKCRV